MPNLARTTEYADLAAFLAVATHRSFRRASFERNVAPSAISHAVQRLEARAGVRLFHRTTRSVSLTEAGERLFESLRPAFSDIDTALDGLNAFRDTPFGTVRLNLPTSIAPFVLDDVMGRLVRENPGLKLDIVATDRLVDIVEEGYDAGIRFGERLTPGMIATRIRSAFRFAVVATPEYFTDRPAPLHPSDLKSHACIRYRYPSGAIYDWQFEKDGVELDVEVDGPVTLDDQDLMVRAALQGCGLAFVWEDRARPYLADGRLVRVLEDWCPLEDRLYLYYHSRRHVSAGLRALIEILQSPSA